MANLRDLAEGRDCRLRIPGYCNFRKDTTVLCHIKRGWHGSLKPTDLAAVDGCSACHDVIDGRTQTEYTRERIDSFILVGLLDQLNYYARAEIVKW